MELKRGPTTSYYAADGLGSIAHLTNSAGALVERYTYDPYGLPTIRNAAGTVLAQSALGNPFLFTGREWESEVGLYDYRARYYHPKIGRFLSRDPLGYLPDVNLCRYVGNNPQTWTDPMGLLRVPGADYDEDPDLPSGMRVLTQRGPGAAHQGGALPTKGKGPLAGMGQPGQNLESLMEGSGRGFIIAFGGIAAAEAFHVGEILISAGTSVIYSGPAGVFAGVVLIGGGLIAIATGVGIIYVVGHTLDVLPPRQPKQLSGYDQPTPILSKRGSKP